MISGIVFINLSKLKFIKMTNHNEKATEKNHAANQAKEEINTEKNVNQAHEEAENDIENDPDFQDDPTVDLDEGELARLEGED